MRLTTKVGLLLCVFFMSSYPAYATSLVNSKLLTDPMHYSRNYKLKSLKTDEKNIPSLEKPQVKEPTDKKTVSPVPIIPAPVTYTVATGDSLTKIGEEHQTEWKRLYFKNTQINNPDTLSIAEVITIPRPDEQLAERPLPATTTLVTASEPLYSSSPESSINRNRVIDRGSSAGNTYASGYCTWYAKNRRPDLPNRLGNASAWVGSATAQGIATGTAPQAGAIAQQGNHVAYVEGVNGDGTVNVSEMNYQGYGVTSSRTVPAGNFRYIY